LEFTILTAARTGETLYAKWSEIDMGAATWTIPADRMKAHKEHRVPLSARALEILEGLRGIGGDYIFPGTVEGRPLYHEAMLDALRRLGRTETVHGLRSSFRDWAAEQTSYPREVIEAALAHAKGKVDRAYQRGDLFEKRRRLMDEWARYCATSRPDGEVVPLRVAG
jgi:integrase